MLDDLKNASSSIRVGSAAMQLSRGGWDRFDLFGKSS
jgi:hypothetical protein